MIKQWDYTHIEAKTLEDLEQLRALGDEGWEAIGFHAVGQAPIIVLKRRKGPHERVLV
jgi:hypothetical protein